MESGMERTGRQSMRDVSAASGIQFGTSGVRGLVSGLTDAVCYAWAQAFVRSVAAGSQQLVIAHDLRPSSPRMAAAIMQALVDAGVQPIFAGALPTPALAHYCSLINAPGIMVTGSHIPFDRNGIKFYRADGEIDKADEQTILDTLVEVPALLKPAVLPTSDQRARDAYVSRYVDFFGAGALAGQSVAVFEHSSVARDVLRDILEQLGARVLSLGRTESFVPIDTEAVRAEDIEQARQWARSHTFNALLSTDGDADRPLIGDETGTWMRGDVVGILCAQALAADVVVTPVSSNTALERCGSFKQTVRTRIGSPYVIAGMQHAHRLALLDRSDRAAAGLGQGRARGLVVVGYEANGGFLLGSDVACLVDASTQSGTGGQVGSEQDSQAHSKAHSQAGRGLTALPTRDAVLPMLALLTRAAQLGCKLSELTRHLPQRFTASDRIEQVPTDDSHQLIQTLAKNPDQAIALMAPKAGCVQSQDLTDGLRITFDNGDIVHLRPSGNAPELRCYAESDTPQKAASLCGDCLTQIRRRVLKAQST